MVLPWLHLMMLLWLVIAVEVVPFDTRRDRVSGGLMANQVQSRKAYLTASFHTHKLRTQQRTYLRDVPEVLWMWLKNTKSLSGW